MLRKFRESIKFKIFRPMLLKLGDWMGKYSTVGDHAVFDNQQFKWTIDLERNWTAIRKELEAILSFREALPSLQEIQQDQKILNKDNNWKTFFLYGFGEKSQMDCRVCPVTTSLLEKIPGLKTAFFSILSPRKHIPAHRGVYKGLIRSHLGLIVPGEPGQCVMRIENEFINWQEGKAIVFDDTYEHEVWNNTNEVRAILLLDVIRPFKFPLSYINKSIIRLMRNSSFVKDALRNQKAWEAKFFG